MTVVCSIGCCQTLLSGVQQLLFPRTYAKKFWLRLLWEDLVQTSCADSESKPRSHADTASDKPPCFLPRESGSTAKRCKISWKKGISSIHGSVESFVQPARSGMEGKVRMNRGLQSSSIAPVMSWKRPSENNLSKYSSCSPMHPTRSSSVEIPQICSS